MRTSKKQIEKIKYYEGLHDGDLSVIGLQPKMCPAGIWTEGYGHAMRDKKGNFIKGIANKKLAYSRTSIHTEAEAEKVLIEDLKIFELVVARRIKVDINQNQFDALVSHTYNTGGSNTLFQLINNKSNKMIITNWFVTKYISADGKVLPGLVARRKSEAILYFS
jgi:lysozyme